MRKFVLDVHNDGIAYILASDGEKEPSSLATVYRMKDGWHTKLANDHTRHAWSGPFESAEDAFQAMKATVSAPA